MLTTTPQELKSVQARKLYLERQAARYKTLERKQDTRQKIQLGGLVKKAGLADEKSAVLLGLLLDAAEKLQGEEATSLRIGWMIKGDIAFSEKKGTL